MKVFRSHYASKVHFDRECSAWLSSTTRKRPLVEVDVADLKSVQFCKVCAPPELSRRWKTEHRQCTICNWSRPMPCEHNGGVKVVNIDRMNHYGKEERRVNTRWRWPENVQGAPLADSNLFV